MKCIVYLTYFKDEIVYVGITTRSLKERVSEHKKHSKNKETILARAMRKHGKNNFIFVEYLNVLNVENLTTIEQELIKELKPKYNMTYGGESCKVHKKTRNQLSKIVKESWNNTEYRNKKLKGMNTLENKKRAAESQKKRFKDNPEYYKKFTQSAVNWDYKNKKIITSEGNIFKNVDELVNHLGVHKTSVTRVLNGKRNSIKGLKLWYLENYRSGHVT